MPYAHAGDPGYYKYRNVSFQTFIVSKQLVNHKEKSSLLDAEDHCL